MKRHKKRSHGRRYYIDKIVHVGIGIQWKERGNMMQGEKLNNLRFATDTDFC